MTNAVDATTPTRYRLNGFAQVVERAGLAITGALCGLFVGAMVARADIEELSSPRYCMALSVSISEPTFSHYLPAVLFPIPA
jgi:hypothetical protein